MSIDENEIIYSFSRINGFYLAEKGDGCFYNWYKTYMESDRGEGNYFSEYGSLFHDLIERWFKGEIFEWDLKDEIDKRFKAFTYKVPFKKMEQSYLKAIYEFFSNNEHKKLFSKYKYLEAENEHVFNVGKVKLKAYIDLVADHQDYGLAITDYKTAKKYEGQKLEDNIKQLYLYSIPVFEKYGKYPDHLIYIYPREKEKKEYVYPFNIDKLEETKRWVLETVRRIETHSDWKPRCDEVDKTKDFYANNLCNHRNSCVHKLTF